MCLAASTNVSRDWSLRVFWILRVLYWTGVFLQTSFKLWTSLPIVLPFNSPSRMLKSSRYIYWILLFLKKHRIMFDSSSSVNFGVSFMVLDTYFLIKSEKNVNSSLVMLLSRIWRRNIVVSILVLTYPSSKRLRRWVKTWQTLWVYPSRDSS